MENQGFTFALLFTLNFVLIQYINGVKQLT